MNNLLCPGTIVAAKYNDFNGDPQTGLFLILYDEQLDSSNTFKSNFVCVKVSTKLQMVTNYCVPLTDGHNDFFDKPCIALCSKVHTFSKDQVYKTLGRLHPYTMKQCYKVYRRFETELERQLEDYL